MNRSGRWRGSEGEGVGGEFCFSVIPLNDMRYGCTCWTNANERVFVTCCRESINALDSFALVSMAGASNARRSFFNQRSLPRKTPELLQHIFQPYKIIFASLSISTSQRPPRFWDQTEQASETSDKLRTSSAAASQLASTGFALMLLGARQGLISWHHHSELHVRAVTHHA